MDVALGEGARDLVELLGPEGDGALLHHLGGAAAAQGDVEIGSGYSHLAPPGLHQDIGEDRDGVLPLHDSLHELEFLHEVVAADDDFHVYPQVSFIAERTSYEGKRCARNVEILPSGGGGASCRADGNVDG